MATIAILCVGSRGDVQPYVALADELSSRGHSVTVATHSTFHDLVTARGLDFAALPGDPREQVRREETQDLMASGRGLVRFVRRFAALAEPWLEELFDVLSPICARADLVVYSPLAFPGWHIAQAKGVPSVLAPLQPFTVTREFPTVSLGGLDFGGLGNRMTHRIVQQVAWLTVRRTVDRIRLEELGMPPLGWSGPFPVLERTAEAHIYGFSRHVVPRPADWGRQHHITGYWFLNGGEPILPEELAQFIDADEPPVYVGFGSLAAADADRLTGVVFEAARRAGTRLVISAGWGGMTESPSDDRVIFIGETPHEILFPSMRAVVHHGGAGTAATAFRAGVPQVVIPSWADQFFWGERVRALGVGPDPISRSRLEVDSLTATLRAVASERYRVGATQLGMRVASENGVADAARLLEQRLERAL